MKNLLVFLSITFALFACNQTVKLDLPPHESLMAVEFYLENGKPLQCLLQESVSFTATPQNPLIANALVILSYNGIRDTLKPTLIADTLLRKVYNYASPKIMLAQLSTKYELYIRDTKGRVITGSTQFLEPIRISKYEPAFNSKDSASIGVFFNDPAGVDNFYRALAYKQKLRPEIKGRADIELQDLAFDGQSFGFYTGYVFAKKDTITMRLYSLLPEHFAYIESVEDAVRANINPFAQPATILSTVKGGVGVFTTLNFDEKTDIILK